MESFFKINIRDWLNTRTDSIDVFSRLEKINFSIEEESFFSKIFLVNDSITINDLLRLLEKYVVFLRANEYQNKTIKTIEQAEKIKWTKEYFQNENNFGVILRTVFEWNGETELVYPVRKVFNDWDKFTEGNFYFDSLDAPWRDFYSRLFLVAITENFALALNLHQIFFVNSTAIYTAITLGLDVEQAISQAIDYYDYIDFRIELSQEFTTFLYANTSEIGFISDTNEPANAGYWIDKFRTYSNKNFDGMSLIRFVEDETIWGNNDIYDKEIIRKILTLYGHLISRNYVYPSKDVLDDFVRNEKNTSPAEVKKKIELELDKIVSQDDRIAHVYERLNDLAIYYKDDSIRDFYYYDEPTGEFKWKE